MAFRRQPKREQPALFEELLLPARPANRQGRRRRRKAPIDCARQHVLDDLQVGCVIPLGDLEGVAEWIHDAGGLMHPFESSVYLAAGHGFAVDPDPRAECGQGGLHPWILHVRPSADLRRWHLRVLHELAHAILTKHYGGRHNHADVWALTLMLACPRRSYRHISLARHVPAWALDLRRMLARAVARAA